MNQPSAAGNHNALMDATRRARDAATMGDLDALESALSARQAALDAASIPERTAAWKEGEAIRPLLARIKSRIGDQNRRLEQIKTGLARSGPRRAATIDLRA